MIARARRRFRPLALVLAVTIAATPLASTRAAYAGDTSPPAGSGSGSGSALGQANKAFTLLFMVFKLVDLCRNVDLPEGGGAPPPQWGSHPDPLPVTVPVDR